MRRRSSAIGSTRRARTRSSSSSWAAVIALPSDPDCSTVPLTKTTLLRSLEGSLSQTVSNPCRVATCRGSRPTDRSPSSRAGAGGFRPPGRARQARSPVALRSLYGRDPRRASGSGRAVPGAAVRAPPSRPFPRQSRERGERRRRHVPRATQLHRESDPEQRPRPVLPGPSPSSAASRASCLERPTNRRLTPDSSPTSPVPTPTPCIRAESEQGAGGRFQNARGYGRALDRGST